MRLPDAEYRRFLETMPIVCVDGVLVNEEGRYLLVKRRNAPLEGTWWVPGGRVHKGETFEQAFHRKMREELGIEVKILMPLGVTQELHADDPRGGGEGVHAVSVVFLALPLSQDVRLDDQSSEWGFFDELPEGLPRPQSLDTWIQR